VLRRNIQGLSWIPFAANLRNVHYTVLRPKRIRLRQEYGGQVRQRDGGQVRRR
jgi:hypothetical protein